MPLTLPFVDIEGLMDIQIVKADRPDETPEQERDYWYAMYREIMELLAPFHVGSPTAAETLKRIVPELQEYRARTTADEYYIEVVWNGQTAEWLTIGTTNQKGIQEYRRGEYHEKPSVEILTTTGALYINRADFKAVRFTRKETK